MNNFLLTILKMIINNNNLKEKIVSYYKYFLANLNVGLIKDYKLMYAAIICLKNNIIEEKYLEYFYSNLDCSNKITLPEATYGNITLGIGTDDTKFETIKVNGINTYKLETKPSPGFNFIYLSIPFNIPFRIYDELGIDISDNFIFTGKVVQIDNKFNKIYKKNNVLNTVSALTFKIKL